jgi:hypothetical protein
VVQLNVVFSRKSYVAKPSVSVAVTGDDGVENFLGAICSTLADRAALIHRYPRIHSVDEHHRTNYCEHQRIKSTRPSSNFARLVWRHRGQHIDGTPPTVGRG